MFGFLGFKDKSDSLKILVVDDEPKIVQTLQDRLEMTGYEVIPAYNGREALEKAVESKPDLILLDVIMPEMDGLEMLEALRQKPGCEDIAVIMLTARSQPNDIARAKACNVADYIVKPFEIGKLLVKIETIAAERQVAV